MAAADVDERLGPLVGVALGVSGWVTLDQATIDAHAEVTGDADWLHNDPARAAADGPFGGSIAQGSLLIGNLVRLQEQVLSALDAPDVAYALNYGFDRIRFVTPVPAGGRIRAHLRIEEVRTRDDGARVLVMAVELELEGASRPAMVATWLGLVQPAG